MSKLKNCPFCGSIAGHDTLDDNIEYAYCSNEQCIAYDCCESVEKWNTRATDLVKEEMYNVLTDIYHVYSEFGESVDCINLQKARAVTDAYETEKKG